MRKELLRLPRILKQVSGVLLDCLLSVVTVWLAYSIRLEVWHYPVGNDWIVYMLAPMLMLPFFIYSGLYRAVFRYTGITMLIAVFKASVMYGITFFLVLLIFHPPGVPRTLGILQPMLMFLVSSGVRASLRMWIGKPFYFKHQRGAEKILIYGAGVAGIEISNAVARSSRFYLAGFIDDDVSLQGRTINGTMVYSSEEAEELIGCSDISGLLLAMPSAKRSQRNAIIERFRNYPVHIKTLPGLEDLAQGSVSISDISEVDIDDLLGRDPLPADGELLQKTINGKVVLVSGAGGSIGGELCRQLLMAQPAKLLLVDHAEYNLYSIHHDLQQRLAGSIGTVELLPLLGDVTDVGRLQDIFQRHKPDIIYHAAAYKHVPLVESNPEEGIRNNVIGTCNMVTAALRHQAECMILVSTDKAVRPTNIMGASKRISELILQAMAAEPGHETSFSMVRFGNVLGSSGSVVPLFRKQIKDGGPVTVTHEEVTRYFMTIPEAAQLVIQAGTMAEGGDVFLLDMGKPVKIMDLAKRMIELSGLTVRDPVNPHGDIPIVITGLRPGEKLYEELLIEEQAMSTCNPRIFKASEHFLPWSELKVKLDEIVHAVEVNDAERLLSIVGQLVPEYQSACLHDPAPLY